MLCRDMHVILKYFRPITHKTNAPTLGTNYAYKSLKIPTRCLTWDRWLLTMIGALQLAIDHDDDGITFDIYNPNRLGNSFPSDGP